MDLNLALISLLQLLNKQINKKSRAYLQISKDKILIGPKDANLVSITPNAIKLLGKQTVQEKIMRDDTKSTIDLEQIKEFIKILSGPIVRLNHVGISYSCENIQKEIDYYKQALKNSDFKLYEENSGGKTRRWLFVGDIRDWQAPLFEIVLIEKGANFVDKWNPHFQIDIDSTLSAEELNSALKKVFSAGFDWKLTIKDYGTVLGMKLLGCANGTKIYIGIGTNLRDTKYHRNNILKELK